MQNLSRSLLWLAAFPLVMVGCQGPAPRVVAPSEPVAQAPAPVDDLAAAATALREAREALERLDVSASSPIDVARLAELHAANQAISQSIRRLNDDTTAALRASAPRPNPTARELSAVWVDDIRAIGEGASARRDTALGRVRESLAGSDGTARLAALMTITQVGDVEYDKAAFRTLVEPIARDARGAELVPALYALLNTALQPTDIELVHAAWERDRPAVGDAILPLLSFFGQHRLEGRSEDIALEALVGYELRGDNVSISGLWGNTVGPRLEARVLELARNDNHEVRHGAIYFGLSTFANKSPAVIDALVETLTDPDPNNWQRALWGLGHGVPTESQSRVVDALVELHNSRSEPSTRQSCRRLVEQYGGSAALARLAS